MVELQTGVIEKQLSLMAKRAARATMHRVEKGLKGNKEFESGR